MGFKATKKYHLVFDETTDLEGLDVVVRGISTAQLLRIQKLGTGFTAAKLDSGAFEEMVGVLSASIVEWNLEDDDDQPVPTTVEGLMSQDPNVIMSIITAWTSAVGGISAPLGGGSTSGQPSLEASLPMETLSPSLSS